MAQNSHIDDRLRILLIEDDSRLLRIVARVFEHEGWSVQVAEDGISGLALAREREFDCLVVDRMLPGIDGITLIRALRAVNRKVPALMLTARGDPTDRVSGLDAGADDYLAKPFAFDELIARIRALVRRATAPGNASYLAIGDTTIDFRGRVVSRAGMSSDLTPREYAVLKALAENAGRVLAREELIALAWPDEPDVLEDVVDLYIHYLRRKLDPRRTPAAESAIRTVRGIGYALRTD